MNSYFFEVECVEREHRENYREKDPLFLFTVRGVLGLSSAGSLAASMNNAFRNDVNSDPRDNSSINNARLHS